MQERIQQALQQAFGQDVAQHSELQELQQHASTRHYWRIRLPKPLENGDQTVIAMVLDKGEEGEDDVNVAEEATSASTQNPEQDFVEVQQMLQSLEVRVPAIEFDGVKDLGVLLLEDLGDTLLEDVVLAKPTQRLQTYESVVDLLIDIQSKFQKRQPQGVYSNRSFDEGVLHWELMHFFDWAIEMRMPKQAASLKPAVTNAFKNIVDELFAAPTTLVLRDFQSRNIMQKNGQWALIDFQDALIGPFCYDLVALLRDSYVEIFPTEVEKLLHTYIEGATVANLPWASLGAKAIERTFALQTLQRKLKDAGRFIFIREHKGNDSFVQYFEPSLDYVIWALETLNDPALEPVYDAVRLALSKPV